jgi:hypothetical protein
VLEQVRHEVFEDPHVGSGKVQPCLARSLLGSGRNDDDVRTFGHGDVTTAGHGRSGCSKLRAVGEVEDFSLRLGGIDIEQGDVAGRATDHGGIGQGGSHAPGSHNGEFGS